MLYRNYLKLPPRKTQSRQKEDGEGPTWAQAFKEARTPKEALASVWSDSSHFVSLRTQAIFERASKQASPESISMALNLEQRAAIMSVVYDKSSFCGSIRQEVV